MKTLITTAFAALMLTSGAALADAYQSRIGPPALFAQAGNAGGPTSHLERSARVAPQGPTQSRIGDRSLFGLVEGGNSGGVRAHVEVDMRGAAGFTRAPRDADRFVGDAASGNPRILR